MNAQLLENLNFGTWETACVAYANTTSETIEQGDSVVFYNEDTERCEIGVYLNLWFYISNGRETSPNVGDNRMMAFIQKQNGGTTYACVTTINKLASAVQTATF